MATFEQLLNIFDFGIGEQDLLGGGVVQGRPTIELRYVHHNRKLHAKAKGLQRKRKIVYVGSTNNPQVRAQQHGVGRANGLMLYSRTTNMEVAENRELDNCQENNIELFNQVNNDGTYMRSGQAAIPGFIYYILMQQQVWIARVQ